MYWLWLKNTIVEKMTYLQIPWGAEEDLNNLERTTWRKLGSRKDFLNPTSLISVQPTMVRVVRLFHRRWCWNLDPGYDDQVQSFEQSGNFANQVHIQPSRKKSNNNIEPHLKNPETSLMSSDDELFLSSFEYLIPFPCIKSQLLLVLITTHF